MNQSLLSMDFSKYLWARKLGFRCSAAEATTWLDTRPVAPTAAAAVAVAFYCRTIKSLSSAWQNAHIEPLPESVLHVCVCVCALIDSRVLHVLSHGAQFNVPSIFAAFSTKRHSCSCSCSSTPVKPDINLRGVTHCPHCLGVGSVSPKMPSGKLEKIYTNKQWRAHTHCHN